MWWTRWRQLSGVIYQRRIAVRVNEKVYMKVVGPTTMYGFETMAPTKRQQAEVEGAELMLRLS